MQKANNTRIAFTRILLVTALVIVLVGASFAAPTLTIPTDKFDFGFVPQQSHITNTFWLHSTGTDTLKILKVVPG